MTAEPVDECAALRALCDAATPGPWVVRQIDDGTFYGQPATFDVLALDGGREEVVLTGGFVEDGGPILGAAEAEDAEFIAASRRAVPSLLARLAVVERDRDEARAQLAEAAGARDQYRDALADRDQELAAAEARLEAVQALLAKWEAERPFLVTEQEPIAAAYIELLDAALAVSPPEPEAGWLQRQAIAARARGDYAAERASLDVLALQERAAASIEHGGWQAHAAAAEEQLTEAHRRIADRQDIIADLLRQTGDARRRAAAAEAKLQPSALFDVIYDAMYGSVVVHGEEREAVAQLAEAVAAALAVSPPEPEAERCPGYLGAGEQCSKPEGHDGNCWDIAAPQPVDQPDDQSESPNVGSPAHEAELAQPVDQPKCEQLPHALTEYGTTNCPVEGVRAFVDDGECSACGGPVPAAAPEER